LWQGLVQGQMSAAAEGAVNLTGRHCHSVLHIHTSPHPHVPTVTCQCGKCVDPIQVQVLTPHHSSPLARCPLTHSLHALPTFALVPHPRVAEPQSTASARSEPDSLRPKSAIQDHRRGGWFFCSCPRTPTHHPRLSALASLPTTDVCTLEADLIDAWHGTAPALGRCTTSSASMALFARFGLGMVQTPAAR
jgi:hypothetical protein